MVTGQAIIDEARNWLGTPYRHQGRQRTVAVDCVGLVFGVAQAVGFGDRQFWTRVAHGWCDYDRIPDGHTLQRAFSLFLPEYPQHKAEPGDVLLIRFAGYPRHTAFLTERDTIIHAYSGCKKCVENRWAHSWRVDTVTAYRLCEFNLDRAREAGY
jgi:NlpC/P60 family putative phage cell wall peptidase